LQLSAPAVSFCTSVIRPVAYANWVVGCCRCWC